MKVLTLKFQPGETVEVHMLNPGEHLPRFGGSRHDLVVGKTASLVVRRKSPMGWVDSELDIHDRGFWERIGAMLDGSGERPIEVDYERPAIVEGAA